MSDAIKWKSTEAPRGGALREQALALLGYSVLFGAVIVIVLSFRG